MEFTVKRENLIESSPGNIRDFYRFESVTLGEGTYGFVRVATKLSTQERFAIKVVPKKRIKKMEVLTREIAVMKQVDHPNIVKLYETYEDARYIYLVMELCEGGELFDKLIEMGHFTEQQAVLLFSQMLSAVAYLHSRNIAHRDLKPENFLFANAADFGSLKLIDFGLAKTVTPNDHLTTKTGTCYYVSPEILKGQYNEKCDIWSLGVILFMMLSGYPPFDGSSDREIIESVKKAQYAFDEDIWFTISPSAKDLISQMFEVDLNTRTTAEAALRHPWILGNDIEPASPVRVDLLQLDSYQKSNQFRKTVLNFMATQCSTNELSDIIRNFKKIDTNHDGTLSINEFKEALTTGTSISRENVENIVNSIDTARTGTIDLTEFVAAMLDKRVYLNEEKLWQAFRRFDIDKTGSISAEALRKVVEGESSSSSDIGIWQEMIREADLDGDGLVSFEEFVQMMERASIEEVQAIRRNLGS